MNPLDWQPADHAPTIQNAALAKKASLVHICTRCGERPRMKGQRWCRGCHAAHMREWRRGQAEKIQRLLAIAGVDSLKSVSR
jgi:ribosomal protein L40E